MTNVVVGQRPALHTRPRSWRIMDGLRQSLDGREHIRNDPVEHVDTIDIYLQWGYRLTPALESVVAAGKPFVIIDGGFFHDRDNHFSVYFNGFQTRGMPPQIEVPNRPRTDRPKVQPWRKPGKLIVVYGQVPTDRSLRGIPHDEWVASAVAKAQRHYPAKEVKFRPHPKSERPNLLLPPMEEDYGDMHLAVTFTSTAGVQTVLAGIPTITCHSAAVAAPVASSLIEQRMRWPGRESWADRLTWFQYEDSELDTAAEFVLQHLNEAAERAAAGAYDLQGIRP